MARRGLATLQTPLQLGDHPCRREETVLGKSQSFTQSLAQTLAPKHLVLLQLLSDTWLGRQGHPAPKHRDISSVWRMTVSPPRTTLVQNTLLCHSPETWHQPFLPPSPCTLLATSEREQYFCTYLEAQKEKTLKITTIIIKKITVESHGEANSKHFTKAQGSGEKPANGH